MKRQHRKPVWRKVRIPTAPPGRCHGDVSKYRRQQLDLTKEYEDDEAWKASMLMRKCKEYCFETFDQMLPIMLGLTLGFFIMAPIFQYSQVKVLPKISEAWSLAWHLGETARVIKAPTDDILVGVLEEAGFEASNGSKAGQLKFSTGLWSATLINEGFRIKLSAGFKDTKVSIEDSNNWNRSYMYTRMYIDQEGDPFLQSYMYLGDDGVSREALAGFCRMYGKALDTFTGERLKESLSNLLGNIEKEPGGITDGSVSL